MFGFGVEGKLIFNKSVKILITWYKTNNIEVHFHFNLESFFFRDKKH